MLNSIIKTYTALRNDGLKSNGEKYRLYGKSLNTPIGLSYDLYDNEKKRPESEEFLGLLNYTYDDEYDFGKKLNTNYGRDIEDLNYYYVRENKPSFKINDYDGYKDYRAYIGNTYGVVEHYFEFLPSLIKYYGGDIDFDVTHNSEGKTFTDYINDILQYSDVKYLLEKDKVGIVKDINVASALAGAITTNKNNFSGKDTRLGTISNTVYARSLHYGAQFNSMRRTKYITEGLDSLYGNNLANVFRLSSLFNINEETGRFAEPDSSTYIKYLDKNIGQYQKEINSEYIETGLTNEYYYGKAYYGLSQKTSESTDNNEYIPWDIDAANVIKPQIIGQYQPYAEGGVESSVAGPSEGLIYKTNELFKKNKINTLINRTFNNKEGLKISRGRNLRGGQRVWTSQNQYSKMQHLVRPFIKDGAFVKLEDLQQNWKVFRNFEGAENLTKHSVLNSNGKVKITPNKSDEGDDITKYMFSIENLAWKDIQLNGAGYRFGSDGEFISDNQKVLSKEQQGPNGGRIMWFPPYDIEFTESVNVEWSDDKFIGRGEPVYTYTNTQRSGTLSFTLLVDHPSVLNYWKLSHDDYNKKEDDLLEFFAGEKQLDIDSAKIKALRKDVSNNGISSEVNGAFPEEDIIFYVSKDSIQTLDEVFSGISGINFSQKFTNAEKDGLKMGHMMGTNPYNLTVGKNDDNKSLKLDKVYDRYSFFKEYPDVADKVKTNDIKLKWESAKESDEGDSYGNEGDEGDSYESVEFGCSDIIKLNTISMKKNTSKDEQNEIDSCDKQLNGSAESSNKDGKQNELNALGVKSADGKWVSGEIYVLEENLKNLEDLGLKISKEYREKEKEFNDKKKEWEALKKEIDEIKKKKSNAERNKENTDSEITKLERLASCFTGTSKYNVVQKLTYFEYVDEEEEVVKKEMNQPYYVYKKDDIIIKDLKGGSFNHKSVLIEYFKNVEVPTIKSGTTIYDLKEDEKDILFKGVYKVDGGTDFKVINVEELTEKNASDVLNKFKTKLSFEKSGLPIGRKEGSGSTITYYIQIENRVGESTNWSGDIVPALKTYFENNEEYKFDSIDDFKKSDLTQIFGYIDNKWHVKKLDTPENGIDTYIENTYLTDGDDDIIKKYFMDDESPKTYIDSSEIETYGLIECYYTMVPTESIDDYKDLQDFLISSNIGVAANRYDVETNDFKQLSVEYGTGGSAQMTECYLKRAQISDSYLVLGFFQDDENAIFKGYNSVYEIIVKPFKKATCSFGEFYVALKEKENGPLTEFLFACQKSVLSFGGNYQKKDGDNEKNVIDEDKINEEIANSQKRIDYIRGVLSKKDTLISKIHCSNGVRELFNDFSTSNIEISEIETSVVQNITWDKAYVIVGSGTDNDTMDELGLNGDNKAKDKFKALQDEYMRYDDERLFFENLSENSEIGYQQLVEKIPYFSPAFHSMTPEGFNARLTFLHQCTRQGPTNTASDMGGQTTAGNLAFGRAPFCVLRLGDFLNTKIVIKGVQISYPDTHWDLNPEGIGVQFMMAKVSLSMDILGGSDITGPINRLQNAVSFNYYANTSVYDNRSDVVYDRDNNKNVLMRTWTPALNMGQTNAASTN